jgi:hypothetical protein
MAHLSFLALPKLREARSNLFKLVGLDDISGFDIVEVLNPDPTLETLAAILHVILETPQGSDSAIKDHDIVSQEPCMGPSNDLSVDHQASSNHAYLSNIEGLKHLGPSQSMFFVGRFE